MNGWIILGAVLLGIGFIFHYPWNAIAILLIGTYAVLRYFRKRNRSPPPHTPFGRGGTRPSTRLRPPGVKKAA